MRKHTPFTLALLICATGAGSSAWAQVDNTGARRGATMDAEARVRSFIADYLRAHTQFKADKRKDDPDQFERWSKLVTGLDQKHCVDHGCMELAGVIHGESPHKPDAEPIISVNRRGDRVYVETRTVELTLPKFFEYELREASGEWRIVRIREYLDAADELYMTDKERPRFEKPPTHPLAKLSKEEAHVDGDAIFVAGRKVQIKDRSSSVEVRSVGTLSVTTGVLVVGDLGYDPGVLSPVGQRVPPGDYPADVAVAFGRNAALRVRFSNNKVATWHPADMGDGGHGVGVDAGNVAIMDVAAIMTIKARDKERQFETFADSSERPFSRMLTLTRSNDTVIAESGWGDGRYPVYWGVDASRKPVVLVVDFLVLPEEE